MLIINAVFPSKCSFVVYKINRQLNVLILYYDVTFLVKHVIYLYPSKYSFQVVNWIQPVGWLIGRPVGLSANFLQCQLYFSLPSDGFWNFYKVGPYWLICKKQGFFGGNQKRRHLNFWLCQRLGREYLSPLMIVLVSTENKRVVSNIYIFFLIWIKQPFNSFKNIVHV